MTGTTKIPGEWKAHTGTETPTKEERTLSRPEQIWLHSLDIFSFQMLYIITLLNLFSSLEHTSTNCSPLPPTHSTYTQSSSRRWPLSLAAAISCLMVAGAWTLSSRDLKRATVPLVWNIWVVGGSFTFKQCSEQWMFSTFSFDEGPFQFIKIN